MSGPLFPHDELEQLIAAEALDGLSELEHRRMVQEMERHGPDCEECQRLVAEYAEVASRLAFAVPAATLAAGAEERLLSAALTERPSSVPAPSRVVPEREPRKARRWIAAVAVAAALAVIGGAAGYLIAPRGPNTNAQLVAFVSQPGTRVVPLEPTPGQPGGRQLAVAFRPGTTEAWVFGSLPELSNDRVYELWFQDPSAELHPGGVFVPKDGTVAAQTTLAQSFKALAVSIEPPGGSAQPTTTPIFLSAV
jgi:anti-sigma-K factor RskA